MCFSNSVVPFLLIYWSLDLLHPLAFLPQMWTFQTQEMIQEAEIHTSHLEKQFDYSLPEITLWKWMRDKARSLWKGNFVPIQIQMRNFCNFSSFCLQIQSCNQNWLGWLLRGQLHSFPFLFISILNLNERGWRSTRGSILTPLGRVGHLFCCKNSVPS